jgi:translation initiation factor 2 alpha subunit (eIF-2alpha)
LLNLSEEVTSFDDIDKFIQDAAEKGNEFLSTVEAKEKMSNKLEYIKDQINPELEKIKASIQVAPDQLTEQEKIQLADL